MPRIPQDELERLKRETDMVELLQSRGVELRRRGKDWAGRCPFHGPDEDPSLVVTPEKGLFHCFGCGASGSPVDLVMRLEGVSFRHAVELLRAPALVGGQTGDGSLGTGEPGPGRIVKVSTVPKLPPPFDLEGGPQEVLDGVSRFYHQALLTDAAGLEYLERRGIGDAEAVARFRVGFANRTLGLRLPAKNRRTGADARGTLQQVGLLRDSGHEHFAGSVVWPFFDAEGHVVEMYGRKVRDDLRRGTPLHLYLPGPHRGFFNLDALRESREVILCESVVDAMTFWVHGFHHVTAAFGAGCLTDEQAEALKAYGVERVLVAFDRDSAGDDGAAAVAARLSALGLGCFRVLFPKGMDANEYALKLKPAAKALGLLLKKAEWMGGPTGRLSVAGCRLSERQPHPTTQSPEPTTPVPTEPSSLAASPEPPQPPAAEQEAASACAEEPLPPRPPAPPTTHNPEPTTTRSGDQVVIQLGDREYRVRGLEKNLGYEQLKVVLRATRGDRFYLDTVDLVSARQRGHFVKEAAKDLEMKEEAVKRDLGRVQLKLEELQEAQIRKASEPKQAPVAAMTAEERTAAGELLADPRLLERILADLETCGLVGEETNKLTGYLAAVSRKLDKPLAVMVQSSSAAGKSALMEGILSLVPDEERVQYSAMTGQSLFYMGETDLKHKVLAIAEEEGAERASYALKLLQSEGKLSIASTGKDPTTGRLVTHEYRVEGPSAILLTTTAIDLDEELLNRCVVLAVDESREQTRAIHRVQRQSRTLEGLARRRARARLLKLHQDAQRLLRPLAVRNPYAEALTFLDDSTRTRRDHEKYLTLIDALALLHQRQREVKVGRVDGERLEYVEVTLADIEVANRLADEVLGRTLDELPPQTRRLLLLVEEMVAARCAELSVERAELRFTRRDVRTYTGWGNTQLKVHLSRLEDMEYLLTHRGGRGQSFVYELLYDGRGKEGGRFLLGLIDVARLRARYAYDRNRSGSEAGWSGSGLNRSGSSRPQVGGVSGPGRSDENAAVVELFGQSEGISGRQTHQAPCCEPPSYPWLPVAAAPPATDSREPAPTGCARG